MTNPLLNPNDWAGTLPPFSQIKPEHIEPAVNQAIENCKAKIAEVLEQGAPYTWESLVLSIEDTDDALSRLWSPVSHMNSVVSNDELRQAHDACLPALSEYGTWVGQHQGLYQAYKSLKESAHYNELDTAQQKVIDNALRDFKLSGIALEDDAKKRYVDIAMRQSELSSQFSNNVMDATMGWTKQVTDQALLSGLPESAIAGAKQAAEAKELEGWLFTLEFPSYLPVMTYADSSELREEMYRAFSTRASEQGPNAGEWDNTQIMEEKLALRHEMAQLLDFDNYAQESLATKMAENTDQVMGFLQDLGKRSRPQAEQELAEVRAYAEQEFGKTDLKAWDVGYYAEKLKQHKYAISDEILRPYFPEQKAVNGLFAVVEKLFGIEITEREGVDTWHKDVRFFDIDDANGEHRGSFYLDLYAREHKRGGAWMDECVGKRRLANGQLQAPVAYLTCNFNKPVGDKPALFTHDEVVTLFHEFGHGIHHMLTKVEAGAVSGISGVPWDAVELPSQFLENWCYQEEALALISGHYETGEPLPKDLLDKMLAAKNFQSAMMMVRQLEFALFDFKLHLEFNPEVGPKVQDTINQVRDLVSVIRPPEFNRFQHSFSHIFAGGYSAGYYSYKWAEVLSADAFSKFEEDGIFNTQTGASFLNNILEKGGSQEPMELFKAFRGREPNVDALLRHSGIQG